MTDRTALAVSDLDLRIGGAHIIDDVSFEVAAGEMLGVIGPNGAGKTTLFNLISGVLRPSGGRVVLDDADVTRSPVDKRARAGLGRTFQTSSLFPELSVHENVRLAAQSRLGHVASFLRFPRRGDEASTIADRRLDEVGLSELADRDAAGLSHGDKRKLEIAMLLAQDADVMLLDEPMAGVGSADVPGLVEVIRHLHKDQGRTILMVEHHMDVVLGLVDRVAVMHHGRLLAIGSPDEVMSNELVQGAYLGEQL
ncbi:amino acid/amide ABC transporter ATP-binding protein 1, HAAT family [Paramicrobacterium humi]|uniref:Amino acid/amide ABC transporter ATP-binding protein 1, HAAT family n=1 Tax=Paramicrobacterium humi TaxID=640635 RepID=A0A1H4PGI6_9MICO|nr:ABC transporter ATP-binding protein [Microbacterium humi]SEC06519.1 amino acid/amide ABC transporter ATP-binding protein 1, HAAT family [Microbacterium humi]